MNIVVHSIPPTATSSDLRDYFSNFGIVENAYISGDRGFIHMLNREDGLKILNTVKNPYIHGKKIYLEPENTSMWMSREPYRDNFPNPYDNWVEQSRDMMSYDYRIPPERNSRPEIVPWKQVNQDYGLNGSKPDEPVSESFVYVDSHGYSRDPSKRPPLEYYYRIKLLDSKSKLP